MADHEDASHTAEGMLTPLAQDADGEARRRQYDAVLKRIDLLLTDDFCDIVTAMATIVCELHHSFDYFHWTGFYRCFHTSQESFARGDVPWLQIGPYQGKLGCPLIPAGKGVCGQAVVERKTLVVPNVHEHSGHIACASSTQCEIVVPLWSGVETDATPLLGVLDVDSNIKAAFTDEDREGLEAVCRLLSERGYSAVSDPNIPSDL